MLGVVAAFGIAPSTSTDDVARYSVSEALPLPSTISDGVEDSELTLYREEKIQRGDTLGTILTRLGVDDPDAVSHVHAEAARSGLSQLRVGRTVRAAVQLDGTLVSLQYLASDGMEIVAQRAANGGVAVNHQRAESQVRLEMSSGQIRSSLFQATDDAGLDDDIASQLAEIFSGDIDFHRDLQPRDRFSVVYETLYAGGEYLRTGKVVAAEFQNGPHRYRALLYRDAEGRESYFTESGKSLKRSFLRSPLEFSRITSGFSSARFHPVLETWRAHRGVDYGAPMGTRVRSTGDGHVTLAGTMRGYGTVVIIKHPNNIETLYGHLSGLGAGLRTGARVRQGDVIGFVGMSGMATGPHLHYELRVDGVHRNPLKVVTPPAEGIPATKLQTFRDAVAPLMGRLELMHGTDVAMHQ